MSESYKRISKLCESFENKKYYDIVSTLIEDEDKKKEVWGIYQKLGNSHELMEALMPFFTEYLRDISLDDFDRCLDGGHIKSLGVLWRLFDTNKQKELFDGVSALMIEPDDQIDIDEQSNAIANFWKNTNKDVQIGKFEFFKEAIIFLDDQRLKNRDDFRAFWRSTNPEVKKVFLPNIIKDFSNPASILSMHRKGIYDCIWMKSDAKLQQENLFDMINYVSSVGLQELNSLLRRTDDKVLYKNVMGIIDAIKDKDYFEKFVYGYFGNVQIDSSRNITFPDKEIQEAIFNGNPENAGRIIRSIAGIINNIDEIRYNIALQKAINTINQGLEFRLNADKLVTALSMVEAPKIESVGLQELLLHKGAEFSLYTDTKYNEGGNAIQRAAEIADKKNLSKNKRKYPDFSFKKDGYTFHVYSPKEKYAMLLGHNTNCCFRPSGNADINKKSPGNTLYDYCNTTAYGGIIDISRIISEERTTVMGTPILVNGNMGLFHSFESKTPSINNKEINELLVEGAKRWIEQDNIDIVMITDLYGPSRVDYSDKIILPPTFSPYLEGEYSKYHSMYTNIFNNGNEDSDRHHIVLSARVNGRVISGQELVDWYQKECGSNPDVLKQKLDLHTGEIKQDYEFTETPFVSSINIGSNQTSSPEIEQHAEDNSRVQLGFRNIVEYYYSQYDQFYSASKDKVKLIKRIHELEGKLQFGRLNEDSKLSPFLPTEIQNLKRELVQLVEREEGISIPDNKVEDVARQIEQRIFNRMIEITTMGNPWEFAEVLGVSGEVKKRIERIVDSELSQQKIGSSEGTLTGKQKAFQGRLIGLLRSELKKNPENEMLNKLLQEVISCDLSNISESEVVQYPEISNAVSSFVEAFDVSDEQQKAIDTARKESKQVERARRIERYSKDPNYVETVMADIMYGHTIEETSVTGKKHISAKDKFDLFKYSITKAIKDREQIDGIMHSVEPRREILKHVDELHFGRKWFIAMSRKKHDVRIGYSQDMDEQEKDEAIEQMSQILNEKHKRFNQRYGNHTWRKVER